MNANDQFVLDNCPPEFSKQTHDIYNYWKPIFQQLIDQTPPDDVETKIDQKNDFKELIINTEYKERCPDLKERELQEGIARANKWI